MAVEAYLGLKEYKSVGKRPVRHDGVDKVTGRAKYGADVVMAGLLHGKVLRSPHAHALIKKIDTRKAEQHPGVRAVITAKDFIENAKSNLGKEAAKNFAGRIRGTLAVDKVYYHGYPVAAVAATSAQAAEEALSLIQVTYKVLDPVLDVREAMNNGSTLVHEDLTTESLGEKTNKKSNIAKYFQQKSGNVDAAFAAADVVVDREFTTEMVHQGYIEPQNGTALYNQDGTLTVWCSSQGAFGIRGSVAGLMAMDVSKVKVVPMEIGGGFGGKLRAYLEPLAALMSKKTGKPVKLVMSRTEVLQCTGPTSGSYLKVKIGAKKDGTITAAQAYLAYESGAFPGSPVGAGANCMFSPYTIPNILIDAYDVVVNKPSTGAYRAPGVSNAAFASETVLDEVAEKIGMDPVELRLKNVAREGSRNARGMLVPRIGGVAVLEAIKNSDHYRSKLKGSHTGRGIAMGFWGNGGGLSSAHAIVNDDGTVTLMEGSVDIGGSRTMAAQHVAEVLGIDVADVHPSIPDTDSIGMTGGTAGSRTAFATGWVCYDVANEIKDELIKRAARIWEISEKDVVMEDGTFRSKTDRSKKMTFKELAGQLGRNGGPVSSAASKSHPGAGPSLAAAIVDVSVDPDTGKVEVLRATLIQDAGKAIHPSYVEGQMQGGLAQGIGWALSEAYIYNAQGHLVNSSFLDYRMPTSLDLPMMETIIVEVPNPGHPYGVRGVGEASIIPPPAAVANAVHGAIGHRMGALPMSPDRILKALWSNGAS